MWRRVLLLAAACVCFALGLVGWLVPVVTGIPFYIAGLVFLAGASERCRRWINGWERRLPHKYRLNLRRVWYKMRWRRGRGGKDHESAP